MKSIASRMFMLGLSLLALFAVLSMSVYAAPGQTLDEYLSANVKITQTTQRVCSNGRCYLVPKTEYTVIRYIEPATVSTVSYSAPRDANDNLPIAQTVSSTCDCGNGKPCICDPAVCRCPNYVPQVTKFARTSALCATPASSPVGLQYDENGAVYVTYPNTHYGRKAARHIKQGVRLGLY